MSVTWGLDPKSQRISVYYTESSTIYEGMPVCFEFNATTNWMGVSGAVIDFTTTASTASLESTTTAEGYQNEGKFIRVEDPDADNVMFFAGVVAGADHAGETGPKVIDIYVANGAIVPVRSYISSTTGVNALAVMSGTQYLGNLNAGNSNGTGRFVAVAMETVDRSGTAGLCLAKLCPDQFLFQSCGSTKMSFATAGTVEVAANLINCVSAETTGTFTALFVRSEVATAAANDVAYAVYGEANVTGVAGGSYCIGNRFSLNLWGGTQTAVHIHALGAEIYEEGANLTGTTVISPLFLRTQIDATNPPAANSHYMITCRCDGADKPDGLLYANSADAICLTTSDAGVSTHKIPINIAGTTRYIMVSDG